MKSLFIGGDFDGQRMRVEDLPAIKLPIRGDHAYTEEPRNYLEYIRRPIHCGTATVSVYVLESLPCQAALEVLIGSYPE